MVAASVSTPPCDRNERITRGAVAQYVCVHVAEGALEIETHKGNMSTVTERPPDRHSFGRKAAVGDADDKGRARLQYTPYPAHISEERCKY